MQLLLEPSLPTRILENSRRRPAELLRDALRIGFSLGSAGVVTVAASRQRTWETCWGRPGS